MGEIAELALATISQAQRRVEVAGQNLANAATPSYKRRVAFSVLAKADQTQSSDLPQVNVTVDTRPGKITETGNVADLAIDGAGYFALRREGEVIYSRKGQFTIDGEGRLIDGKGFALQTVGGGDLILKTSKFLVNTDGTVSDSGSIVGKIAVFASSAEAGERIDGPTSDFTPLDNARIGQGRIEASNVATGDEMVAMVEAMRRAESGQRIMQTYDDLMGRVITIFGDSAR